MQKDKDTLKTTLAQEVGSDKKCYLPNGVSDPDLILGNKS